MAENFLKFLLIYDQKSSLFRIFLHGLNRNHLHLSTNFEKIQFFSFFAVHFEYPERTFFPEERFYLVPDRTLFHARPDKEVPYTSQGFLKFELPRKFLKWPLNRRTGQLWLFNFLIREKKGFSEIGGHFFRINVVPRSKNLCKE